MKPKSLRVRVCFGAKDGAWGVMVLVWSLFAEILAPHHHESPAAGLGSLSHVRTLLA